MTRVLRKRRVALKDWIKAVIIVTFALVVSLVYGAEEKTYVLEISREDAEKCKAEGGCFPMTVEEAKTLLAYVERLKKQVGKTCL